DGDSIPDGLEPNDMNGDGVIDALQSPSLGEARIIRTSTSSGGFQWWALLGMLALVRLRRRK
ncbi:MAG: hypothetical protein P1U57_11720, partial [Oleibacter sp.]|nr:hypothetical protein [Thalassolituus sp.]